MRKPPVLTTLFLGTTVLLTCLREMVPGLVPALRRDPSVPRPQPEPAPCPSPTDPHAPPAEARRPGGQRTTVPRRTIRCGSASTARSARGSVG